MIEKVRVWLCLLLKCYPHPKYVENFRLEMSRLKYENQGLLNHIRKLKAKKNERRTRQES